MTVPADLYTNRIGNVLVLAPTPFGRLRQIAAERKAALHRGGAPVPTLSRWIFADFPRLTLQDAWGNPYDHAVHTLLVGSLAEGVALVDELRSVDFVISDEEEFFVPFQTLDPADQESSDRLRERFPRAFAVARRDRPQVRELLTFIRDARLVGEG